MRLRQKWVILVVCVGFLAACRGKPSPVLSPLVSPVTSPLASPVASPLPTPVEVAEFILQQPLKQGQETVSGTGPPRVPIRIVDITYMGDELGYGVIDQDGTFSIAVSPLASGHRVGIMLGDVSDPERRQALQRGGQDLPMVGIVLASAMVGE